jgi:hypothetical protein
MKLLQWLVPLETGGLASAITPRETTVLELEGRPRARGPVLDVPGLPFPLTVGQPAHEPAAGSAALKRVRLALVLVPDGQPAPSSPLAQGEDDVGGLSLLGEYASALALLLEPLDLPLEALARSKEGTLELRMGPLKGLPGRRAGWTLLLLAGAADVLARARGFRVEKATAAIDDEDRWRPVDGSLPGALAGAVAGDEP